MRPIRRDAPGDVSDYMDEMIHGQAVRTWCPHWYPGRRRPASLCLRAVREACSGSVRPQSADGRGASWVLGAEARRNARQVSEETSRCGPSGDLESRMATGLAGCGPLPRSCRLGRYSCSSATRRGQVDLGHPARLPLCAGLISVLASRFGNRFIRLQAGAYGRPAIHELTGSLAVVNLPAIVIGWARVLQHQPQPDPDK